MTVSGGIGGALLAIFKVPLLMMFAEKGDE